MRAWIFWLVGAVLAIVSIVMAFSVGAGAEGITDYRAWMLLVLGILALTIGNFSGSHKPGP